MATITRAYLRKNCTGCDRARSYLAGRLEDTEVVDARKVAVGPEDLPSWFRGRKRLLVANGKKWQEHQVRGLSNDERAELVIGRSGKLRAPALIVADALVVGFHAEAYDTIFD